MDPAVMTMVNVTLCLVLVGYFLNREDDLLARRSPRGRHHRRHHRRRRTHHWRRGLAHWPQARRGSGRSGHP
jgi:hypothetical protein